MSDRPAYRNPILPGFYPDPSICRVGGDFYLVNSSFAYFPGIPISHSRDLVHWEQIGNVLDRPSQLPLEGAGSSRGIFAPAIRHSGGRFYVACTNVDHGGNFIVQAEDPAGPWSEPAWLEGAPGIDPSLFFDEGGRAWYCGTRPAPEGEKYPGDWEVWLDELDLSTMRLKGEARGLWRGALRNCVWPEGPHIYRAGGWYYLMIAEGGTGLDHAVSVARSREIGGPYVGKASNPILTHRQLGRACTVVNVGHGDLVDDGKGGWWMVLLASRPFGGGYTNLGRETFLVPVAWEDEWPLPCPGEGFVREEFPLPRLERFDVCPPPACEHFDAPRLDPHWLSLRGPASAFSSLSERPGFLRLRLGEAGMRDRGAVSFVGRRQLDLSYSVRMALEFSPEREGEAAGLVLFQGEEGQYRLELALSRGGRVMRLVAVSREAGGAAVETVVAERPFAGKRAVLAAVARGQDLAFAFGPDSGPLETLAAGLDGRILSTERAGGFVGTVIGAFASGNGKASRNFADIDWFEYRALQGEPGTGVGASAKLLMPGSW
jgi:xylan 1,4-beta-xylosidase